VCAAAPAALCAFAALCVYQVDKAYIEDGFNLYGLRQAVSNFQDSMDIILDHNGKE
jgi:hypothetical protein